MKRPTLLTFWYGYEVDPFNIPLPRPGVYMITNRRTNKNYVGAAKNIASRLLGHPLRNMPSAKATPLYYLTENDFDALAFAEDAMFDAYAVFQFGYNRQRRTSSKSHQQTQTTAHTRWITNGSIDQRIKADTPVPTGWRRGRSNVIKVRPAVPKEAIPKMRAAKLGKIRITNGAATQWVVSSAAIPDGWRRGQHTRPTSGKYWINDGTSETLIDQSANVPPGWQRGRLATVKALISATKAISGSR
jgi:hypothetical protein